ncbi:MAG: diguanylate cyclase domain, partial [Thermoleophilia bacterium]|nr:diguanylate cyclase domain [Thermoleophilia bacterium]
ERVEPLGAHEQVAFRDLALALRAASWDVAMGVVETGLERDLIPSYAALGTIKRLANLPAFIGGLAMAIMRPAPGRHRGVNPILARLARDHVIERERCGFSAREIVQEFLLLRRVMWRFVQEHLDPSLDARTVLKLEDLLNSILDEVIAECTVIYFDRATQELSEKSRRDSLTGLLNHQAFNTRLDDELDRARRYGGELQVIYFDLDDFKNINDEQGHHEGDRALVGLAAIVLDSIRDSDFAGRIGGDEFVIGLVESEDIAAHLLLDRLRARLAHAVAEDIVPAGTHISAGCAGYPLEADTAQDLLVVADRRLYDDKRARKAAIANGTFREPDPLPPSPDPSVELDEVEVVDPADDVDEQTASISSPAARAVARAATMEPAGESVVVPVGAPEAIVVEPDPDPETRRVVDAARQAIEDARRRAESSTTQ